MFNTAMFYLNFLNPAIPQFIRFVLSRLMRTSEGKYGSSLVGYTGWVKAPLFGVLAFRRDDGSLQYRW